MELPDNLTKPYSLRLDNVSIFRAKKTLDSLKEQCRAENISIFSERKRWSISRPFKVTLIIKGKCPIPKSEILAFRKLFEDRQKELIAQKKRKKKNRRKFF